MEIGNLQENSTLRVENFAQIAVWFGKCDPRVQPLEWLDFVKHVGSGVVSA